MNVLDAYLKEYETLFSEIREFQRAQRTLVLSTVAAVGSAFPVLVFGCSLFEKQCRGGSEPFLVIGFGAISTVVLIFMLIYVSYFSAISRIAQYLQHHLEPLISECCDSEYVMNWHFWMTENYRKTFFGKLHTLFVSFSELAFMFFSYIGSLTGMIALYENTGLDLRYGKVLIVFHIFVFLFIFCFGVKTLQKHSLNSHRSRGNDG